MLLVDIFRVFLTIRRVGRSMLPYLTSVSRFWLLDSGNIIDPSDIDIPQI